MEKNILIRKLKKGNHILLETKECIYDIEIISPEHALISVLGGRRFAKPTKVSLVGAYGRRNIEDDDSILVEKEIEKNVGIELQYNDKDNITVDFVTSPILSAKIYGETWSFEMWESTEQNKKLETSLDEARARVRIKNSPKEENNDDNDDENTLS